MKIPLKQITTILLITSFFVMMTFCCSDQESSADVDASFSDQHESADATHYSDHSHEAHNDDHHDVVKVFTVFSKDPTSCKFSLSFSKIFNNLSSSIKQVRASLSPLLCNSPPNKHLGNLPIYLHNSVLRI